MLLLSTLLQGGTPLLEASVALRQESRVKS
jgi:hypothetical protein